MATSARVREYFQHQLEDLKRNDIWKEERVVQSPQAAEISVAIHERANPQRIINFCANNYLGLSSHPEILRAAQEGMRDRGYGLSSVRFICGTQDIHRRLEKKMSAFLQSENTILFSSCFDANGGVFESLLGEEDVILSDELNHASLIDGIRLCKARRHRYRHNDMADLEHHLQLSGSMRFRMIATDGVFSMDGDLAKLDAICALARKYDAIVMVDDSHATGFIGKTGRGTPEFYGLRDSVDIITTTFGKALGGASGGCVSGKSIFIDTLRQKSRPYLFSNSLSPVVVAGTLKALDILESSTELRDKLEENAKYFRRKIRETGFEIPDGFHPIVPILLHNPKLVQAMARGLLAEGIYVVGFSYPVVPKGKDRIRVQISAAHERKHLDAAITAFGVVGKRLGIIT